LLGLVGHSSADLADPIEHARKIAEAQQPPLASAWLRVSLALHGLRISGDRAVDEPNTSPDILLAAVEALGAPGGNAHLLDPNGASNT